MKNTLLELMADVLHPERQEQFADHPNRTLKGSDLTQSTPAALLNAVKEIVISSEGLLSDRESQRMADIKARRA